jgi:hypothetical protein
MSNQDNSPNIRQGQGSNNRTQRKTIFNYLLHNVATASMVANATGIPQKCITRYKRDFETLGILVEVKKDYCEKTNHLAWYLTTNPDNFPQSNQLQMF